MKSIEEMSIVFICSATPTTEIYTYLHTLSLHDARPISKACWVRQSPSTSACSMNIRRAAPGSTRPSWMRRASTIGSPYSRSEEHTSELQSLMRISYAVFCLKKNNQRPKIQTTHTSLIQHNSHNQHTLSYFTLDCT